MLCLLRVNFRRVVNMKKRSSKKNIPIYVNILNHVSENIKLTSLDSLINCVRVEEGNGYHAGDEMVRELDTYGKSS